MSDDSDTDNEESMENSMERSYNRKVDDFVVEENEVTRS